MKPGPFGSIMNSDCRLRKTSSTYVSRLARTSSNGTSNGNGIECPAVEQRRRSGGWMRPIDDRLDNCLWIAECNQRGGEALQTFACGLGCVPAFAEMPDSDSGQVTEDDAADIPCPRLHSGGAQLRQLPPNQLGQFLRIVEKMPPLYPTMGATDEYGIDDRGAGAVDMYRPPHLGRAWKGRGAGEPRIQDGNPDGAIGLQRIVVES